MKRTILWGLMGALLAAGSVSADRVVRIGTWKTAQTLQPYFYQPYLGEQIRCDVRAFTNPADQKTALLAGSLEMCATTLAHAIHSAAQGQPVVVVAAVCNKCSALVVRRDRSVERIADLKGLRIGYVPGTMHEVLLREALTRSNLSPEKDVRLTRVDFFDMGLALARGGIDAFLSGEPFPSIAVHEGYGRILAYPYFEDAVGAINAAMLVTRERIEREPEMVYRLVKAHAQSSEHLIHHPQQWLAKAAEFGTPAAVLQRAAANMELAWMMDAAYVAHARALGARMQALKMIDRQPDYDRLFDLRFVAQALRELDR